MAHVVYPAIVERAGDGYSVFFPDVPGCVSAGHTAEEVYLNAEQALAAHLELSHRHGDAISPPSRLDALEIDADVQEVARILVMVETPGKILRLNITMDEGLVASIDRIAKNRSAFLAEAAREKLAAERELATV